MSNKNAMYRKRKTVGHKINAQGNLVPIEKNFYGKTKKEVEEKYLKYLADASHELTGNRRVFGFLCDEWINNFFLKEQGIKGSTKTQYYNAWMRYVANSRLYTKPIKEIHPSDIQTLYYELDCPPSTLEWIHAVMTRFYAFLEIEYGIINFTNSLKLTKSDYDDENKEIVIWEDDELHKIMTSFDKAQNGFRLRFLIILGYYTGCRISELLALTYDDFTENVVVISKQISEEKDFTNEKRKTMRSIKTPKSMDSIRKIPLNTAVLQELEKHLEWHKKDMKANGYTTNYVFTTNTGMIYDRHNIPTALRRYYKRIGVEYKKFHTYRHTFGTNLCRNGIPIQTASVLLGHKDINITAKYYVNVNIEQKQEAVDSLMIFSKQ